MLILFIVFVLQFSISCACLALNTDQQVSLISAIWSLNTNILLGILTSVHPLSRWYKLEILHV